MSLTPTFRRYLRAFCVAHPEMALQIARTGGEQMCKEVTEALVALFPEELAQVRGHVILNNPDLDPFDRKEWPHWWCVTKAPADATGPLPEIIDLTADQFPRPFTYRALDESLGEPTGRCPNCGGLCYDHSYLCSEKCEREYVVYVEGSGAFLK